MHFILAACSTNEIFLHLPAPDAAGTNVEEAWVMNHSLKDLFYLGEWLLPLIPADHSASRAVGCNKYVSPTAAGVYVWLKSSAMRGRGWGRTTCSSAPFFRVWYGDFLSSLRNVTEHGAGFIKIPWATCHANHSTCDLAIVIVNIHNCNCGDPQL